MGGYSSYYKGEKKKPKKVVMEKKATEFRRVLELPKVEITGKKGK